MNLKQAATAALAALALNFTLYAESASAPQKLTEKQSMEIALAKMQLQEALLAVKGKQAEVAFLQGAAQAYQQALDVLLLDAVNGDKAVLDSWYVDLKSGVWRPIEKPDQAPAAPSAGELAPAAKAP